MMTTTTEGTTEDYEGWEDFWSKRSVESLTDEFIMNKNSTLIVPQTFKVSNY